MGKTILLVVDKDWSVVRWGDDDDEYMLGKGSPLSEVYAEHTSCPDIKGRDNTNAATWCWEYTDGVWNNGYEVCWRCETQVSAEAVALVILMNMDK